MRLRFCQMLLVLAAGWGPLAAQQVTGKIEGTVSDPAGAPVAGAQVLILGSSFGAVTNDKGYYFINNVPVGTHTLRAQFIGFTPAEVRGVRVQGGQTATQDIKMESSAVQLGTINVTAAENPIVPRDQVTSKSIVSGELVSSLPVDNVRAIVSLTPGVVESGANNGVSIRGGRPGEANVYIDGAPVRSTSNGAQRVTVGTNALEEASVTTGAIGVEFSDAQSGIISFTTRAGGPSLAGALSYESDEPFGNSISVGYNRLEGSLGGPVPGITNLTWFGSAIIQGQMSQFRGAGFENLPFYVTGGVDQIVTDTAADGSVSSAALPQYVQYSGQCGQTGSNASAMAQAIQNNYGYECQGRRLPMDWATQIQMQGKLQYSYGSGSVISFSGLATGNQTRFTPGTVIGNPGLFTGNHNWQRLAVLNWFHQVSRSAERALSLNLNLSYARDRGITGALDPASEIDSRSPGMGVYLETLRFAGYGNFPFPIGDDIVRNVRSGSGLRIPLLDRTDLTNAQGSRANPYGMQAGSWFTSGFDPGFGALLSESRYNARMVVDWQANRYHRLTLGGDAKKTDLSVWASGFLRQNFMNAYVVHPVMYGFFGADRLDLGDVVLEVGARYDYYNSRTLFARTPGRIATHPDWDPAAATDDAVYAAMLADTDIFVPSVGHSALSPRLRVSFPVTEQTGFRLSYAHQVQSPDFNTLLTGINNDLSFTNLNDVFGRDLDFGKSILFEFGVRHAFTPDLVLDVSAYNKDKVSDFAARILPFVDPRSSTDTINANVLTNLDFGNSRGVDMKVDWRVGTYLSTAVAYTFQVAKGTGSDPFSYLNTFARQVSGLTGDRTLPPEQAQRTNDDRTHNLVGSVSLTLPSDWKPGTPLGAIGRSLSVFATFRAVSGLPYTRLTNTADGQVVPFLNFGLGGRAEGGLNNAVLPWTKNIDLRINKGFSLGRVDFTAYADVRNLMNWKSIVGLFAETGDVVNADFKEELLQAEFDGIVNEAQLAGALLAGDAVDLTVSCANWASPLNCESLRRVEARFGNGDQAYTLAEQTRALDTYYNSFFGPSRFYAAPRHVRLGLELSF
jgi:carboxypeptidase family protein/TonB-dependent receptor-like protein